MLSRAALSVLVVAAFTGLAHSLAYTVSVGGGETRCFHTGHTATGKKVAFYFAVQSGGGDFDIGFSVSGPDGAEILADPSKKQGDFVFTAQSAGEYAYCLINKASANKIVDLDITVEDNHGVPELDKGQSKRPALGQLSDSPNHSQLEDSIFKIQGGLHAASRALKNIKTREHRSMDTVESTQSRIFFFALTESLMILAVAAIQVYVVRMLFAAPLAKGRV